MYPKVAPGKIRPKVSTMPRPKSQAADYLNIYKLEIEKKRLLQELQALEQRRHQINERMMSLDSQIAVLENGIQQQRIAPALEIRLFKPQPVAQLNTDSTVSFDTLFLEY